MIRIHFHVWIVRKDETAELGGTYELDAPIAYADATEQTVQGLALDHVLPSLTTVGANYRFGNVVFPKSDFRTLRADIVQVSDLAAALADPLPES